MRTAQRLRLFCIKSNENSFVEPYELDTWNRQSSGSMTTWRNKSSPSYSTGIVRGSGSDTRLKCVNMLILASTKFPNPTSGRNSSNLWERLPVRRSTTEKRKSTTATEAVYSDTHRTYRDDLRELVDHLDKRGVFAFIEREVWDEGIKEAGSLLDTEACQ